MGILRLVMVVTALLGGIAIAAEKPPETFDVWLRAGVDIDDSGHVQELRWEPQSKAHAVIAERLTAVVRGWEFVPATANGKPAPTRTGLLVHILADELADGSVALRLADARTGPTALTLAPPAYPMEAARNGITAKVLVTVEVNADGSPVIRAITYENTDAKRAEYYRKAFLASATEAVKGWKFRPEIVAGHVVPGASVRIPIDYCLDSPSQCDGEQGAGSAERKLPAGVHMGDSSAVALKTDIRTQVI